MPIMIVRIVVLMMITLLTACGGDIGDQSSGQTTAVSPQSQTLTTSAQRGKVLYDSSVQGCLSCHGPDGQSQSFKPIDLDTMSYEHSSLSGRNYSLEEYINKWMPVSNPSACVGSCANDIASYIREIDIMKVPVVSPPVVSTGNTGNPFTESFASDCMGCHTDTLRFGGGENLVLAGSVDDFRHLIDKNPIASQGTGNRCENELIIDSKDPDNSLLLKVIDQNITQSDLCLGKMPLGSQGLESAKVSEVRQWIQKVLDAGALVPNTVNPPGIVGGVNDAVLVSHGTEQLLRKTKTLLHGGAVTNDDLDALGISHMNDSIEYQQLGDLVDSWMNTREFDDKMLDFFEVALQQSGGLNQYQPSQGKLPTNTKGLVINNLKQIIPRTALRIIKDNEDFRSIVTTNKWQMTTSALASLAGADSPNGSASGLHSQLQVLMGGSQFSDWRTITFNTSTTDEFGGVNNWLKTNDPVALISLGKDGDPGIIESARPAIGFMNSPAFFQTWPTNVDNQYRVTVSQALLVALGKTFDEADATAINQDIELDAAHSPKNSSCYGCHKNMDPMRNFFLKHYSSGNMKVKNRIKDEKYNLAFIPRFYNQPRKYSLKYTVPYILENKNIFRVGHVGGIRDTILVLDFEDQFQICFSSRKCHYTAKVAPGKTPSAIHSLLAAKFENFYPSESEEAAIRAEFPNNSNAKLDEYIFNNLSLESDENAQSLIHTLADMFNRELLTAPTDFVFHGSQGSVEGGRVKTMQGFADSIANHPLFARAWALRVCEWMNAVSCDVDNDELQTELDRVVSSFVNSGHNFKTLVRSLATSKLVTHTSMDEEANPVPASTISIIQKSHFCHSLKARFHQIQRAQGKTPTFGVNFCEYRNKSKENRAFHNTVIHVPEKQMTRGDSELTLQSSQDILTSKVIDTSCKYFGEMALATFANYRRRVTEADRKSHISLMAEFLLGYTKGSPEHQRARDYLDAFYQVGIADSNGSKELTESDLASVVDDVYEFALDPSSQGQQPPQVFGLGNVNDDAETRRIKSMKMVLRFVCKSSALSSIGM